MNLRKEDNDEALPPSKFNVGDNVNVKLNGGKSSFLGKIIFINTYCNKKIYTVDLGIVLEIGKESADKDIKLLKPVGLSIRTVNLYEEELSEIKLRKHIMLPSHFVSSVPITPTVMDLPQWDDESMSGQS